MTLGIFLRFNKCTKVSGFAFTVIVLTFAGRLRAGANIGLREFVISFCFVYIGTKNRGGSVNDVFLSDSGPVIS